MKFKRAFLAALAIGFALVTPSAYSAFWQWSQTPATNASVDPTINWREGMAPSAVNDSARAMMAVMAAYRDDVSGALTTGGISTAYTVATNQLLPNPPTDGQVIAVTMSATNGISATLSADGGAAFAIQSSPGVAVVAGVLVQGTPYSLKFSSANSAWLLRNFYNNPFNIPIGGLIPFTGSSSSSSNFVLPSGQCISRTTYAAYFALVSTTYGSCDGSTTFGVPDLRGRAIFAQDNMNGTPANRITVAGGNFDGTALGATGGAQNHTLTQAELSVALGTATSVVTDPGHSHGLSIPGGGGLFSNGASKIGSDDGIDRTGTSTTGITVATTITNASGGNAHPIMPPAIIMTYLLRII